jgi:hypothetical protein
MMSGIWPAIALVFLIVVIVAKMRKGAKKPARRISVGPGASGTIYDWLNQDKRNRHRDHRRGKGGGPRSGDGGRYRR